MQLDHGHHLSYCTNIHPAETWEETLGALQEHTLKVRDMVGAATLPSGSQPRASRRYAIGLRLSARAAEELLKNDNLPRFQDWLAEENCYVFTINGFPYGAFHGTRVKENVYRPDWSTPERLTYTNQLFEIISQLAPESGEGSVSTLPGSFKAFNADESAIFRNLEACARHIEELSGKTGRDLHLGLEPEPLGHFENTQDTLAFFERLLDQSEDPDLLRRRLGLNYDTCHFAVEFDDCRESLDAFRQAGLRISKVHLSNALAFDPGDPTALDAIKAFDEPTYLHQLILNNQGKLTRFTDLPEALPSLKTAYAAQNTHTESRVHFHIPLYSEPLPPLRSTVDHVSDLLAYRRDHPEFCTHFEIETYTWGVLPGDLQKPIVDQIAEEYRWVLAQL
ncbi:MAG: metabolite traffic protein EboE [Roseibacillus sp.]